MTEPNLSQREKTGAMPDLELLTCVGCVARVDATSEDADGWVLVERSVLAGERSDDKMWCCGQCSTPVERAAFMAPIEQLRIAMWPQDR
jgi:hypothetical protein